MKNIGRVATYRYEKYYEENFGRVEERLLTKEELHDLYFMCEIACKYDLDFLLGFAPSSCTFCLHKTPEDEWVASYCDERSSAYICGVFDNLYDACILLIHKCANKNNIADVINKFNGKLNNEVSDDELEKIVCCCGYYDELFYHDLCYTIKRMSNIEVDGNDEEINQRILDREKRFFPSDTSLRELQSQFFSNIARILNIDTSDLDEQWYKGKIDYQTYEKLKLERFDIRRHQDLVLRELEKYGYLPKDEVKSPKQKLKEN